MEKKRGKTRLQGKKRGKTRLQGRAGAGTEKNLCSDWCPGTKSEQGLRSVAGTGSYKGPRARFLDNKSDCKRSERMCSIKCWKDCGLEKPERYYFCIAVFLNPFEAI